MTMSYVHIAVIAALEDEIRIAKSKIQTDLTIHVHQTRIERGKYLGVNVLLVQSGVGKIAMKEAVERCLADYRPAICLHVGYCGGADPKLSVGDVVIASHIIDAATGKRFEIDANIVSKAEKILKIPDVHVVTGGIVTVDKAVCDPHEKAFIGTEYEAIGIDMESSAVIGVCESYGTPLLVARAVLDPMDICLPDMKDSLEKDGSINGMALAEHMIRRPKDILSMPRLAYAAFAARTSTAFVIDSWIKSLGRCYDDKKIE